LISLLAPSTNFSTLEITEYNNIYLTIRRHENPLDNCRKDFRVDQTIKHNQCRLFERSIRLSKFCKFTVVHTFKITQSLLFRNLFGRRIFFRPPL
jgi:hypothetical protein